MRRSAAVTSSLEIGAHRAALPGVIAIVAALLTVSAGGCARPYGVPPFTQLVAEAPGQAAAFEAPDEGTVWVAGPGRPGQDRHIVFSGLVHRGESLAIDPRERSLMLDGKPVQVAIEDRSFYQVWYQPVRHDLLAP